MDYYDEDDQIRGLVDRIQKDYQCCGAVGPDDWDRNEYYNCNASFASDSKLLHQTQMQLPFSSNKLPSACGVPASCCRSMATVPAVLNTPVASFPGFPLNEQCGFGIRRLHPNQRSGDIFLAGCADHLTEALSQNLLYVAVVALAISCFELISILLAFMLIRRIMTVIEYMVYVNSGHFVEVDPSQLPMQNYTSPNRRHRRRRHSRRRSNDTPSVNGGSNLDTETRQPRSKPKHKKRRKSNSSLSNGTLSQSALQPIPRVENIHDIQI